MSEWISVKDRLPEQDGKVLCWYGFKQDGEELGRMYRGCLDYYAHDDTPHFQHGLTGLYVTHWMPLPEPPEVEQK